MYRGFMWLGPCLSIYLWKLSVIIGSTVVLFWPYALSTVKRHGDDDNDIDNDDNSQTTWNILEWRGGGETTSFNQKLDFCFVVPFCSCFYFFFLQE